MREIEFRDFRGLIRKQYNREASDDDESVMGKIECPNRVQVFVDCGASVRVLPAMDLATFKANLRRFKPMSVVNYRDMRYSSVVVQERYD